MNREEQFAKSVRYLATPYVFVPQDDGRISICTGWTDRRYLTTLPPEDVIPFLRTSWDAAQERRETRLREETARREAGAELLKSLGL